MKKMIFTLMITLAATTFSNAADVVIYDGSVNEGSWPSWGSATAPCTLTLNGSSAVTTSTDYYLAGKSASLNLGWLSGLNGTTWPWWTLDVAANAAWSVQDISGCTKLRIWLYSPTAIAANALPQLFIKNGSIAWSSNVKLGTYATSGIPAATWTKVEIPVSDFAYSSTSIDRIVFHKDMDDNVVHTLYIGDITFTSGNTTRVNDIDNLKLPFYNNGILYTNGISGAISIRSIEGKLIISKEISNESVSINLAKGCYLLNCSILTYKFIVK